MKSKESEAKLMLILSCMTTLVLNWLPCSNSGGSENTMVTDWIQSRLKHSTFKSAYLWVADVNACVKEVFMIDFMTPWI